MSLEKCPVCSGKLYQIEENQFACNDCKRVWVDEGGGEWSSLPQRVNVDFSKMKEGEKYSDAVKITNNNHENNRTVY